MTSCGRRKSFSKGQDWSLGRDPWGQLNKRLFNSSAAALAFAESWSIGASARAKPHGTWGAAARQGKLHTATWGEVGEELNGMGTSVHATFCLGKHVRGKRGNRLYQTSGYPTRVLPRGAQPCSPTDRSVQPVRGHTRAGACQGGTSPFKPVHDVLLLSGPCQNGFLMFQVAIKYRIL